MQAGETMFEYLKRKKRNFAEEESSKAYTNNKQNISPNRPDLDDKSKQKIIKPSFLGKSAISSNSTTPQRLNIIDEERTTTRSFLKMISPIRNKSTGPTDLDKSQRNSPKQNKQKSIKDNYTKKNIYEHVNALRDVIEGLLRSSRSLKQKSNCLFVDLKPMLKHFENCPESNLQRKSANIQARLRAIQKIYQQFDVETSQQRFDQFYQSFSQYLNQLQGNSKADKEQYKNTIVQDLTRRKNAVIEQLEEKAKKYERDMSNLNKKYQKLQSSYEQLQRQHQSTRQSINIDINAKVVKLTHQNQQLKQYTRKLSQQLSRRDMYIQQFEKQKKQLAWQRQKYQQQCLKTIAKVKSEQEQFLLNEIMVLKKQFHADMVHVAQLNKTKQDEYIGKLRGANFQIEKQRDKIDQLLKLSLEVQDQANSHKAQALRYRKQNECLATDMHRINEELYQHWLALKDIKTLSSRLDIYYKFKKIYEELSFNQQLFL